MKGANSNEQFGKLYETASNFCEQNDSISKNLYSEYGVKRGLRDEKGQGVLDGAYKYF